MHPLVSIARAPRGSVNQERHERWRKGSRGNGPGLRLQAQSQLCVCCPGLLVVRSSHITRVNFESAFCVIATSSYRMSKLESFARSSWYFVYITMSIVQFIY